MNGLIVLPIVLPQFSKDTLSGIEHIEVGCCKTNHGPNVLSKCTL